MRLDLILSMMDIYINSNLESLTKFRSIKYPHMEHLLDDPGNHPIKPKNDQKLCDKKEHQNSMYTDTNT